MTLEIENSIPSIQLDSSTVKEDLKKKLNEKETVQIGENTLTLEETMTKASIDENSPDHSSPPESFENLIEEQIQNTKTEAVITPISREYKTDFKSIPKVVEHVDTELPEKDTVLWQIKDFTAFRSAAHVSKIPPLVSPEFGGGCCIRLQVYDKSGHISGRVELPLGKALKDGVAHLKISVIRPNMKTVLTRKLEMQIKAPSSVDRNNLKRLSEPFYLTCCLPFLSARIKHLIFDDILRLRIEFQYFPFDSCVFRGLSRSNINLTTCGTLSKHQQDTQNPAIKNIYNEKRCDILSDINTYCNEDLSQYVEIRRGDVVYQACRFLLCARSTKFRDIFKSNTAGNLTQRGNLPLGINFGRTSVSASQSSLSSITLQDISHESLSQLLTFIHTDTCEYLEDKATDIMKILELFEVADVYGVDTLKKQLREVLSQRLDRDNFVYLFEVSQRCDDEEFKKICSKFMDSMPGSQVATIIRILTLNPNETPRNVSATT